jgi:hypothetical protein
MRRKRILIIICDPFLVQFLLVNQSKGKLEFVDSTKLRFYPSRSEISLVDYLLEALSKWGKKIGIRLVKESILLTSQTKNSGVSDVYVISSRKDDSLASFSKNVVFLQKDITKTGATEILKRLRFKNLLTLNISEQTTQLTKYSKKKGTLSVVSEQKSISTKSIVKSEGFIDSLRNFRLLGTRVKLRGLANDASKVPIMNLKSRMEVLKEYFLNKYRLKDFPNEDKLSLKSQESTDMSENLIVISGSVSRLINNIPLILLSLLTELDVLGNYLVFFDKYGLFSYLQRLGKHRYKDILDRQLLLEYWGALVMANSIGKATFEDVIADVDVKDGDSKRQVIPMFGKITNFKYYDGGDMSIEMRDGYRLYGGSKKLKLVDLGGNFLIDARARPIESSYKDVSQLDLLLSWMKGIGAITK